MLKTHLILAWRTLTKHPGYAFLNLGGLALGIAAAFVLGLYVRQELTYDAQFQDGERIYRIATDFYEMGGFANSQTQLFDTLPQEMTGVEAMTRLKGRSNPLPFFAEDTRYEEADVLFADPHFFEVFAYEFLAGSPDDALSPPDGLILTEDAARRFFGTTNALGRTVLVGKDRDVYRVTGVVETPPGRTHLNAQFWLPLTLEDAPPYWTNVGYYNYVKLRPGATQADLEAGLDGILRRHAFPATPGFEGTFEEWAATPQAVTFFVQPLRDIYLHSAYSFELGPGGSPTQVYALGIVGLFLLLIAGVNYVNLTTARASARAKEVGVKKTMGAGQGALVRQFLAETTLFSLLAAVLAAVLAEALLGVFAYITGEPLVGSVLTNGTHLLAMLGFALAVGLLAGLYPAFYLARFRPSRILKGTWAIGGNNRLRSSLVVGQFAIAIVLVVGSLVVYRQLDFMQSADKGLAQDGVLFVNNLNVLGDGAEPFRQQLIQSPIVEASSLAQRVPTGSGVAMYTFKTEAMEESITIQTFVGDEHYLSTLGMRLLAGRGFSADLASDSSAVILNEAAVLALGLGDDPIGQIVNDEQEVIGVVADFHFQSLRDRIEPVVLMYGEGGSELVLHLRGDGDVAAFLDRMNGLWRTMAPDTPIRTSFLDDNFAAMAAQERMLGRAVSFFTLLALVIAAMGLFGLVAFAVQRRTKEIGIRKVLGAGVPSILGLLSKDFVRLVGVAFLIAAPVAYLLMDRWLDSFAYRVEVGMGVFVTAGLAAIGVALLTVSTQAYRAAATDPINALRYE